MHYSALNNCELFFETYRQYFESQTKVKLVDLGSQDVNGSLKSITPSKFEYTGVDFVMAKGVDVVLDDPYTLPFGNDSVDIVLSSSCFEHSEMFWLVFLEIMRILKPGGLFYLNVPSNGDFHRYPVDSWRFYPDSGSALVTWGRRNGIECCMLESYISDQKKSFWNDYVAVFLKDEALVQKYNKRILDSKKDYRNGKIYGSEVILNHKKLSEDQQKLGPIRRRLAKYF